MKFRIKNFPIGTGGVHIILMNSKDAIEYDFNIGDRIFVKNKKHTVPATIDITESDDLVLPGQLGLFKEVSEEIRLKNDSKINIVLQKKPESIMYIKKKLEGERLNYDEFRAIMQDIVDDKLTDIELTYFVAANHTRELSIDEIVSLTRSMVDTGDKLNFKAKIVVDKHCIGGVAANRTSMVVVPILASAGLLIPKTSSRSITSAAGTADTMEVLCDVEFSLREMKNIVKNVGCCLIWGGGDVNLAPADDKIIRVEHPVSLDPIGQLISSILAKKISVGSNHILIDIPVGRGAKTSSMKRANMLKKKFEQVGKKLGLKIKVLVTDGSEPIGNGIGPALEARDVIRTLRNHHKGSTQLKEKSIELAGEIFELAGKTKNGQGKKLAREIIDSGKAHAKFVEMLEAQKIKAVYPETIQVGEHVATMHAMHSGKVTHVDNKETNKVAKIAGAPFDKGAGIQLYVHKGYKVARGDKLFSIYAENKERLEFAIEEAHKRMPVEITKEKKIVKKKAVKKKVTSKKIAYKKKVVAKKIATKKKL